MRGNSNVDTKIFRQRYLYGNRSDSHRSCIATLSSMSQDIINEYISKILNNILFTTQNLERKIGKWNKDVDIADNRTSIRNDTTMIQTYVDTH